MGEARRRAAAGAPARPTRPPSTFGRVAPYVFAWCPRCRDQQHLMLTTAHPATEPLTAEQRQQIEAAIADYLTEVSSMCPEHRRGLSVSASWPGGRPADAIRDPHDAPEVVKWRRFNCWLADVKFDDRGGYEIEICTQGDGDLGHMH